MTRNTAINFRQAVKGKLFDSSSVNANPDMLAHADTVVKAYSNRKFRSSS